MFVPKAVETFRFLPYDFDVETGVARLNYALDDAVFFTEEFKFPVPSEGVEKENLRAVDRALFLLSLAAGTSYYKAAVPKTAVIETGVITEGELSYIKDLYFHGLGEFAYVNELDLRNVPDFSADVTTAAKAESVSLERKSLVAVGGGKDSCVAIESMRAGGPVSLASVNRARPILEVMSVAGLDSLHIERKLSPELLRINAEGAYNGHVPVTAIVSIALLVTALLNKCDVVVMSNERSASVGNVERNGVVINHQYSKSLAAEKALADVVQASIASDLTYFSLLRPLSELEITRRFSSLTQYHSVFTSCNKAFRLDASKRINRWCTECPKCRFVFLSLAAFMEPDNLVEIFGRNLLDIPEQATGFDELIGWNSFKPFECVGEVEESLAAFVLVSSRTQWQEFALVRRFTDELRPGMKIPVDLLTLPFISSTNHYIPTKFKGLLDATA